MGSGLTEARAAALPDELSKRHFCYLVFWLACLPAFHAPLASVLALSQGDGRYRDIPVIPLISAFLIYSDRRRIFRVCQWRPRLGAVLLAAAVPVAFLPRQVFSANADTVLASGVLATILVWTAGFVFCYGTQAFRSALFSFCFLLLAAPLPTTWLDQITIALQKGSAGASYVLFRAVGVPVLRDGFHFSLPGVNIEVARQCSGINSSLALFTVGVLSAYLFLRSTWSKALLIAVMVPLLIAKNVLRIATICWLSVYVSPDYLHGNLHRHGGLPFAIVGGLTPLLLSVIALRRCETWLSQRALSARLDRGVTEAVIEDMGGGGARRTNGSLVAQHADYRAVIDGENLAVTWKVSGYCRAASETAIGFSIDAETNIPFDNLDCVGFDLRRDPGRRHPIRPVLVGPDGISKKVSVPFLAPLSSQEPFHVVLTCDLPGCMKAREDYCAVTLSFDQDRVARYTMRLTFAHSRPDWVRAYECKPDGEPRLLRSLQAQAKDRSAFDYVDDEYDIAARTTRIYVFRRACRARIAADDEAL